MFKSLAIKAVYRSDTCNILKDFYLPALEHTVSYDRAVGFFSVASLFSAAQGISALLENDGNMRLVVGGELSTEDIEAIELGYNVKGLAESYGRKIATDIDTVVDSLFKKRIEALSLLVASGRLDIQIAYKPKGMYHEKIGILTDSSSDKLIFQGSANETQYALISDYNFESINVFQSWVEELKPHYTPYIEGFKNLWEGTTKNVHIAPFPEALRDNLIKISKKTRPVFIEDELALSEGKDFSPPSKGKYDFTPAIPKMFKGNPFDLFDHQRAALNAWRGNGFTGILELATGAGKTVTAITGLVRIYQKTKRLCAIISVPYQNLADQWIEDLARFNINAFRCYGSKSEWHKDFSEMAMLYNMGSVDFICAVVVNRTFSTPHFQTILNEFEGDNLLFIGDECHHHSSERINKLLPQNASARMGLSATPWHYMDNDADVRLKRYYSNSVFEYNLEQALDDKVLTKYRYHVVPVEFTDKEITQYLEVSQKISQLFSYKKKVKENDKNLQALLLKRSRIIASAQNKFTELSKILEQRGIVDKFSLFYCGDGRVEDEASGDENRQIEQLSKLLHTNGWKTSRFTSRESTTIRHKLLDQFRIGIIDSLVAIRCLDEGIDIPVCKVAFMLASSTNPRQQVQRRGRILRKAEGKKYAEIYDFIVRMPEGNSDTSKYERQLLKKELTRVAEFASLAMNSGEVINSLLPLLDQYELSYLLAR